MRQLVTCTPYELSIPSSNANGKRKQWDTEEFIHHTLYIGDWQFGSLTDMVDGTVHFSYDRSPVVGVCMSA